MGYCSVQDLESYYLNKSFKCGDYLTNGKAQSFIEDDTALINSALKVKYSLPIIDTNDLIVLKVINAKMVVGTIDDIFREKTDDGKFDRGRDTRKEALAILTQIKNGDMVLDGSGIGSVITFNLKDSYGNNVRKRFKDVYIEPNEPFGINLENKRLLEDRG